LVRFFCFFGSFFQNVTVIVLVICYIYTFTSVVLTTIKHFQNSGMPGHIHTQCQRPNLEACSRNEETVVLEIERAATVRYVEQSLFDANSKQQQQQQQHSNNSNSSAKQQRHRQNDNRNNHHHRGSGDGVAATTNTAGQSRYGSIDRSRNSRSFQSNSSAIQQQYERGRSMHRPTQLEQPHFRPFKSMPLPSKRQNHQHDNRNNNYHNRSDSQPQNYKRNRNGGGGDNNRDLDVSSPHNKRRRPN
jgi:hypothetical protein